MCTAAGADEALVEVERLRKAERGARRSSSMPLLAFSVLTMCYIPLAGQMSVTSLLYWSVAGPLGFLLVALWYRRRRVRLGVGAGNAPYAKAGLILFAAFALVLPLTSLQLPAIGIALLVIAIRQRNAYLGTFAVVFGLIGLLGTFSATLENLMYHAAYALGLFRQYAGYFNGAPALITAAAALLLLAGGLVALRQERRVPV